ncbi:MAG: (d)CMP kinase [Bacteroidetes bacterium]|nr:(d)CMP kinase [Bacteroidota bacterium]
MEKVVVAIDGPSGTGKSTSARILAEKLNYVYIDSGAMYRAITLELLKNNIKPNDIKRIVDLTSKSDIKFEGEEVFLNGKNVTKEIRSFDVTSKVSSVSAIKEVRKILVDKQRAYAKENNIVMDGRDIGTVVFPNAKFKFFLVCDLKTRAARRRQDFIEHGMKLPIEKIMAELKKRDDIDSKRKESPLKKAKDAVELNTTNMIIEEQVNYLLRIVNGLD